MSETQLPWGTSARFVKVICSLGLVIPDGTDVDRNADLTTQGGKVTIICNATKVRLIPSGEPGRMLSLPSAPFTIAPSTGELFDTQGVMGLYVLDPKSPDIDPQGFTYTATVVPNQGASWSVTFGGNTSLPDVVDLVRLASIAPATGVSTLEQRIEALEADTGSGAYPVQQVALTGNLAYTLPADAPADQVISIVFTQDGTGGHTVTYGGTPVTVDQTAGASTLVEVWPGGTLAYPGANPQAIAAQVGTLTLPAAPTAGQTISVLADSATVMPEGVRWDSGGAPVVAEDEQRIVTLIWSGTDWVGTYSLAFGVPVVPTDTTAPVWAATFTLGTPTETAVTATASALATDDTGVTGYQVSYDDGVTSTPIGVTGSTFTLAGSASTTYATTKLRAMDAAGNLSAWLAVPSYTMASPTDTTPPAWTATFTLGTPTPGSIPVTPSALATDDTAVTSYEATLDSTAAPVVWSSIGMPAAGVLTITGLTASTTYASAALRAKDASGNASAALAVPSFTTAAPAAPPDLGWFASYYADDLALTNGAEVPTWEDRSASYDMIGNAGRRPVYVASDPAFGGAPSIDFDIAGVPYLRSLAWTANDQPNTFVVVGTFPYVSGEQAHIFSGRQSNAKHNLYRHPTTGMLLVRAGSTTATSATIDPADGLAHLIGAIVNGSSTSLILDDAVVPLTGDTGAERSIGITLGADEIGTPNTNIPYRGRIAFVGVIDGIATEGQLADLWAWARDRYGL